MARKFEGNVDYMLHDNLDIIFDEKGSQFCALRKVQWGSEGMEPDSDKAKLELRKWISIPEGKDRPGKGMSFLTEEGPHELAKVLVDNGFGKTKDILLSLKNRDDFKESVNGLYDEEDETSEDYFDARQMLLE